MTLRTSGDHPRRTARRPSSLRLSGACAAVVVVLLSLFAGSSRADVTDYAGTQLWLIGPASSVAGSYKLLTSSGAMGGAQADTRPKTSVLTCSVAAMTCGYMPFSPGVTFGALGNSTPTASPMIPATCKGWTVDAAGGMVFPAGTWQFLIDVRLPAGAAGNP